MIKTLDTYSEVSQTTINQRLKFLIEALSPSVRAFSEAIGDSSSNTQNYIGARKVEPKPEYLSKVLNHFNTVNAHWLITGQGEPFLSDSPPTSEQSLHVQKNFRSPIVGTNHGTANQQQPTGTEGGAELQLARQEIEHLRQQLRLSEALLASKDETIILLRASYNRPN